MKATPLAAAEDALARLDERLAKSPIREGWIARTHFTDACASLWLDGELAHHSLFQIFVEGASAMRTRLYELPSPSPADPESGMPGLGLR